MLVLVHMINTLLVVNLIPVVNCTIHHALLNFRITIDFHCVYTILIKCSQRSTSMPPVHIVSFGFSSFCKGKTYRDDRTTDK
jgi:hypothetical protein